MTNKYYLNKINEKSEEKDMTASIDHLPKYTKEEEIYNASSHFLGTLFAIATLITFIILGINKGYSFIHMLPFYLYSTMMMFMFTISGIYHSRPFMSKSRSICRIIDHCDIYPFIAATYFPICIYGITNQVISTTLIYVQVTLALTGIILNLIPTNKRITVVLAFIIYIIQGWIIILFYPFNIGLGFTPFLYILIGGIVYSIGSIMYGIGRFKKWSHTYFHIFVLLAAIIQFIGILYLI